MTLNHAKTLAQQTINKDFNRNMDETLGIRKFRPLSKEGVHVNLDFYTINLNQLSCDACQTCI